MKELNVAYIFSRNIINEIITSMNSIIYKNKHIEVTFHLISDITESMKEQLLKRYNIFFYDINSLRADIKNEFKTEKEIMAYLKLNLCNITNCNKILYLDSTLLCNGSLDDFTHEEANVSSENNGEFDFKIMLLNNFNFTKAFNKRLLYCFALFKNYPDKNILNEAVGEFFEGRNIKICMVQYDSAKDFLYEGYFYDYSSKIKPYMVFFEEIYNSNNFLVQFYKKNYKKIKEEDCKSIPIGGVTDENCALQYITVFSSIIDNYKLNRPLVIRLLCYEVNIKTTLIITGYFKTYYPQIDFKIVFLTKEQDKVVKKFPESRRKASCTYITNTTLLKPFLSSCFQGFDKYMYVDADIIAMDDVSPLIDLDLRGYSLGATFKNDNIKKQKEENIFRYFNSGVLVFNNDYISSNDFWEFYLNEIESYRNKPFTEGDQTILNKIVNSVWYDFGRKYNICVHRRLGYGIENGVMYHYTSEDKPWNDIQTNHKLFKLYNDYNAHILQQIECIKKEVL